MSLTTSEEIDHADRHPEPGPGATCRRCRRNTRARAGRVRPLCRRCAGSCSRRSAAALAATALAVLTAVALLRHLDARRSGPAAPTARRHDPARAARQEELEARLSAHPCDQTAMIELGELLNTARQYRQTIRRSEEFLHRCGRPERLLWVLALAHERTGARDRAERIDGELITRTPDDADYWWWRAENRRLLGQRAPAAADLRQSIALDEQVDTTGANTLAFARLALGLGQPCEALVALHWRQSAGGELPAAGTVLRTHLERRTDCRAHRGTGSAAIPRPHFDRPARTGARVGDRDVHVLIDPRAGTTLISPALARSLALSPGVPIQVLADGRLRTARATTLDRIAVDDAEARHVSAAIADDLPPGIDAVIGLSFLWRFALTASARQLDIRPLAGS